jgi:putative CocE/NonD family hydrolase
VLEWYDYWLKGLDTELVHRPPVLVFMLGSNAWREAEDWPLPETRYETYYLHSSGHANDRPGNPGTLDRSAPREEPPDAYRYDPRDPAPSFTANVPEIPVAGPSIRRHDVLVFSTPALTEPTAIAGPITARLWAATSAPDTDWVVRLVDVDSQGSGRVLSEGMIRARYRESQRQPSPVVAREPAEYRVELVPVANCFLVGHRIRVEVTSSAAPLYHPNLNTGGGHDEPGPGIVATQLLFHDQARPSHIVLPIVPAD